MSDSCHTMIHPCGACIEQGIERAKAIIAREREGWLAVKSSCILMGSPPGGAEHADAAAEALADVLHLLAEEPSAKMAAEED